MSIMSYLIFTTIFALLILLNTASSPDCVTPTFDNGYNWFTLLKDSWHLSWTTFSTVGYGMIFPQAAGSHENKESSNTHCLGITILLSLESFVGITFVSFCSAIIFGRSTRYQSNAQITFSENMVIRFGDGILDDDEDDLEGDHLGRIIHDECTPCPIIAFRMVNLLHSNRKGEIIDANVSVVVTVPPENADTSIASNAVFNDAFTKEATPRNSGVLSKVGGRRNFFKHISRDTFLRPNAKLDSTGNIHEKSLPRHLPNLKRSVAPGLVVEDENELQPNLVFSKLDVHPEHHPFFRRVWRVSHVLDDHSPLLCKSMRQKIFENGGFWPPHMTHLQDLKDSIKFDNFMVSFTGLSNTTFGEVFKQKVYTPNDLLYGYSFKSIFVKKADGSIGVLSDEIDRVRDNGVITRGVLADEIDLVRDNKISKNIDR